MNKNLPEKTEINEKDKSNKNIDNNTIELDNFAANNYDIFKANMLLKISKYLIPFILFITICLFLIGLYFSLWHSPTDLRQGEYYRIMFIHVPSAWVSLLLYCSLSFNCFIFLITKHPLALYISDISAIIGSVFTIITLVTGSLWGIPMWGTYWVWDARLTSVLVLFFIYISFIILSTLSKKDAISPTIPSILAIFGLLNIPIIKFSVDWWNTLHQPASVTEFGSTINFVMLIPLILMFIACLAYVLLIYLYLIRIEILKKKIEILSKSISRIDNKS